MLKQLNGGVAKRRAFEVDARVDLVQRRTKKNRNHIAGGFSYQQGIRGPGIVESCNANCLVLTGHGSCNAHISATGSPHLNFQAVSTCTDRFQRDPQQMMK